MMSFIYKALLNLTLFIIIQLNRIKIHIYELYYFLLYKIVLKNQATSTSSKLIDLNNNTTVQLSDIPKHVCIIINELELNNKQLVNLILCFIETFASFSINNLTFYKYKGISKSVRQTIADQLESKPYKVHFNEDGQNGRTANVVNVTFLSQENGGKCLLTNAIKNIALKTLNNEIDVKNIKQDLIDQEIYDISHLTEPQLLICVGLYDTLAGFSPWHIRLSEIMSFSNILLNYTRVSDLPSDTETNIDIEDVDLQMILTKSINTLFGELGSVGLHPKILKYNKTKKTFVLQTIVKNADKLTQAFTLTDGSTFMKTKFALRILNTSNYLLNLDVNSREDFF